MKKAKRLLSLILVLVMLFSNLPVSVLAAEEQADIHEHESGEICTHDHSYEGEDTSSAADSEVAAGQEQENLSDVPADEQTGTQDETDEATQPGSLLPEENQLSGQLGGINFVYDAGQGSVTVNEQAAVSTLGETGVSGVSVTATPAPGYDFVAWINADSNLILSSDTTAVIDPLENPNVGAIFTAADGSSNATFVVGTKNQQTFSTNVGATTNVYYTVSAGATLYTDLNAAISAASSGQVIVVKTSGVLPAGDYTIPSGVTLLIPFDSAYTMYTSAPQSDASRVRPSAFCTLTMASGAKLTVKGELSVSGRHLRTTSGSAGTAPNGSLGWINMNSGSQITVNSGAKLYAWGFITGSGNVVANSGASVYENFQVTDFRGGSATSQMAVDEKVFPFSQYYVQNIEVPMYLYAGAKEYSYVTLFMSENHIATGVNFIGSSNSMFNLKSGYVIKRYDGATDRLMVDAYGDMEVSSIAISMGTSTVGFDIDTSDFELPIASNITVRVHSGSINIKQDITLLPGAKIIVEEGAKCIASASAYLIDADDWGGYSYLGKKLAPLDYAPGKSYTRTEKDLVDAEIVVNGIIDASNGYAYVSEGGAAITGSDSAVGIAILRSGSTTGIYVAIQTDTNIEYTQIPVRPAKLKNADGTYVTPAASTYYFSNGAWGMHVWDAGVVTVAATCTQPGTVTYTCVQPGCANCGSTATTRTETIPALGHTAGQAQREDEAEATCTTGGSYKEVVRCATCNSVMSSVTTTVDALGHDIVIDEAVAPTCTATGLTQGEHCSRCSDATVKQEVVAATGHTAGEAVKENVVAATCTTAGSYDSVAYCKNCGIEMSRTKGNESALGHNSEGVKKEGEVAATCTADGSYTKVVYCTRCGVEQGREYVAVDKLGHDTEGTGDVTAPTCTAQGYTTYSCKRCDYTTKSNYTSATGHTEVTDAAVAPTCTDTGLTAGVHCSVCNTVIVAQQVQAKLGHDFGEHVNDNNATCTANGTKTAECSRCDATDVVTIANSALGHSFASYVSDNNAGCETDGTETAKCDRCDATDTRTVAGTAKGHTSGEPVKENIVEDTCSDVGGYNSVVYCTVCDAKISSTHVEVNDITQHVFEMLHKNEVSVTCTTDGSYEIYYDCKYCDIGFSGGIVTTTATGHTSGTPVVENTVAATCTADGSYDEVVYCSVCGGEVSRTKKTVAKLGHTSGAAKEENRVEASCTVDGSYDTVVRCTVCNEVISSVTTVLAAPGHTPKAAVKENEIAATCTADGSYDEVVYCSVCGEEISRTEKTVAELGHTPGAAADCENPQTCTVCGTQLADALGHSPAAAVKENVVDASCETDGSYDEVVYCSVCGEELSREKKTETAPGHSWSGWTETVEPTCTEAGEKSRSCSVCNEPETQAVAALGHDVVPEESKAATCTEDGLSVSGACSRCDYTEGETVIPALGHDCKSEITTPATCTSEGLMTYTCQREDCEHSYTEVIPVASHVMNVASARAADCEEDGWKVAFFCDVCGTYFADDKATDIIGDADDYAAWKTGAGKETGTGHTPKAAVKENEIAATCTSDGSYDEVVYCSSCGDEISRTAKTEAKLGHTPGEAKEEDRVEASCTADGNYNTVVRCAVCDTILSSTPNTIASTGHSPAEAVKENVQSAMCTEPGSYDEVVYCAVCGEELSREKKTDTAPGHSWSEWSESKAPTCTAAGEETRTCSVCGETEKRDVDAAGHSWSEWSVIKAPTCTAVGEESRSCSVCNETEKRSADATGHDLANLIVTRENEVAATCDTAGSYDVIYTCPKCSEVLFTDKGTIPATGHTFGTPVVENTVAASCSVDGSYDKVVYCEVCDKEVSREKITIPAAGHSWGEEVTEKVIDATCTADGSYDTVIYCSVCEAKKEGSRVTTTVPALEHDWSAWTQTKVPNCNEEGEETRSCGRCSEVEKNVLASLGHKSAEAVIENEVAATCTAAGSYDEVVYCSVCDAEISRTAKTVAMKTHTPGEAKEENRVEATCTTDGSYKTVVRCTECDTVLSSSSHTIAATGHTPAEAVKENEVDATCTEDGKYDSVVYCSDCDAEMSRSTVTIPALGHTEGPEASCEEPQKCTVCGTVLTAALGHKAGTPVVENAVAATCTTDGSYDKAVYCDTCGKEISREKVVLFATGHSLVLDAAVPATCTEDGLTAGQHCETCGHVQVAQNVIPSPGHNWDAGVVQVEATCLEDGEMLHTCAVCEETKIEIIEALGHDLVQHEAKNPTYSSIGWEAYETCSRCDYSTYVEIPMLERGAISDYETFMENLAILEGYANEYAKLNPGKDPMALLIKYIRTGVDRYNSGSWGIMAGYEDAGFAQFVQDKEDAHNDSVENQEDMIIVTSLKNINNFILPSGEYTDFGHMFGTMDISYHNIKSQNHADVSGWAGDLVDLLEVADYYGVEGTVDEMIAEITDIYFLVHYDDPASFSDTDFIGDLDGYYVIEQLKSREYSSGMLCEIFEGYFTEQLSRAVRADYFLKNRLGGVSSRDAIRDAVFNGYTSNQVVATLEATRTFQSSNLSDLRRATCYAFADYLCKLAGDYVVIGENIYYDKFYSENSTLAPGITQQINMATTADGKQIRYYIATGDITSQYVNVYANYYTAYPENGEWGMARVRDQANAAQARYGDPESPDYIENYNVITAINGAGYNMSTGEPGGLLVMNGVEYHGPNANGFFGILDDGTAYIGTTEEYNTIYKDRLMEGIAGFGSVLIRDGKIVVGYEANYTANRASRTAVGITRTGKVVFMVLDGRQEPVSCGGSMQEIAQIMLEAGCVVAINLDGGGSTTYIAKQPGEDELTLVSSPSDGFERSVGTSLMMVSTAPSSTAFDHAVLEADNSYMTVGAQAQLSATGVSPMGNSAEIPEGATWAVSDPSLGSIDENGVFTALGYGDVYVYLMLDGVPVGTATMHVVRPDAVYFTRTHIDAVYGEAVVLPVAALYQGKPVTILEGDVVLTLGNTAAGTLDGFTFTGDEASGIKNVTVTAALSHDTSVTASIIVNLYNQGEASFDFNQATGGDRMLAWDRQVSNSNTEDGITYMVETVGEDMVTSYIFAIDMTQIPIPERLSDLVYMLPGADVEGANSAWNFLLQLAERISPISEVKPVLRFDENMEIDYSGLTIVCEYFELTKTEFDEENNTLTLILNWKDQTQAIDPETANPICIVSGVKLTPKDDAAWDSKDRLNVLNSGEISYTIGMRASALYTFAQKEENQETYGIYPYVNPNDESDRGGMFSDVYKEFEDSYTLVNSAKSGWVYEEGGYAYYVDGEKLTGIQLIDGYYYDFGENGINAGQTKFTGLFQIDGVNHYAKDGVLYSGWITIGEDQYCFDENGAGYDGSVVVDEVELIFENGKLVGGYTGFITKADGQTYHYVNGQQTFSWFLAENGYYYHFDAVTGAMTTGTKVLPDAESKSKNAYYDFADDGRLLRAYFNPAGYYYWAGLPLKDSWVKNGYDSDLDAWYRTNGHGHYVTDPTGNYTSEMTIDGVTYTVVKINVDGVIYTFNNANGKLLLGAVVNEGGEIYYYWAGEIITGGWFTINGETYYAYADGHLARGNVSIDGETYVFSSQGVLQSVGGDLYAAIADDGVMTITYTGDANNSVRFAIWGSEAGQSESLVWINAEQDEDGNWVASLSMCTFGIEDKFVIHAYSVGVGNQRFLSELFIELSDIGHIYDDMYDLICNACGYERPIPSVPMFRMYDPNSGEHFYTGSEKERDFLVNAGWNYEGVAFNFPVIGAPVYRLYNPVTGDHLYTMDEDERAKLLAEGWNDEGVAFNSATEDCVPQYRLWNPNAVRGAWHFTGSERERDYLISLGWQYQGIGWYSMLE